MKQERANFKKRKQSARFNRKAQANFLIHTWDFNIIRKKGPVEVTSFSVYVNLNDPITIEDIQKRIKKGFGDLWDED